MTIGGQGGPTDNPSGRQSLFALIRSLVNDVGLLVRQEIELAQAELVENARKLARYGGLTVVGAVVAVIGVLVLVEFLVIGLGVLLDRRYWLSSLLIALLLLGSGAGAIFLGVRRAQRATVAPSQALLAAKDTKQWAAAELADLKRGLADKPEPSPIRADAVSNLDGS